jgi:tetraacyldisaccharide 4'-kinase
MKKDREENLRKIMAGSDHSPKAALLRAAATAAEPFYATVMRLRNKLYDAGIFATHSLGRPTISVGNLTTGGTGKTPVVAWLCQKLQQSGEHPAVLLRGYKTTTEGISDEAAALRNILGKEIPVIANPDRVAAAAAAIDKHPEISVFVLDDAMQHRRARRDFELVLINARNPFGFKHILPRGLLREPASGLKRADAVLITHCGEVPVSELKEIDALIWRYNPNIAPFRSDHVISGFRAADGQSLAVDFLQSKKYFAFCALGSPESFLASLAPLGGQCLGSNFFPDHYAYGDADLAEIRKLAGGADALITTEKDWAKLSAFRAGTPPILRAELALWFPGEMESLLFEAIHSGIYSGEKTRSGRRGDRRG